MNKKVKEIILLIVFANIFNGKAQQNADVDSLDGFDMAGALEHASHLKTSTEKNFFFEHAKRTYKIDKYELLDNYNYGFKKPIMPKTIATPKGTGNGNKTVQGPQPLGCNNIDFEAGDT